MPNRAARSLASRQTQAVALVVPEDITRFFGDPYFAAVVQGITRRLDESDYMLNLLRRLQPIPGHKTMRYLRGGNVDGALVVSHHTGDEFLADLESTDARRLRRPAVESARPEHLLRRRRQRRRPRRRAPST